MLVDANLDKRQTLQSLLFANDARDIAWTLVHDYRAAAAACTVDRDLQVWARAHGVDRMP